MNEADMNALPNLTQKITRHLFGLTLFVGLAFTLLQPNANAAPPTGNAVESVETTTMPNGQVMVRVNLRNALNGTRHRKRDGQEYPGSQSWPAK